MQRLCSDLIVQFLIYRQQSIVDAKWYVPLCLYTCSRKLDFLDRQRVEFGGCGWCSWVTGTFYLGIDMAEERGRVRPLKSEWCH